MFANIIIDIAHEKVDRTFQYLVPQELEVKLKVGMQVRAPFGAGNKLRKGYVMEITERAEFPVERMKSLHSIVESAMNVEQHSIELASWMRQQYGATMIQCLKTVLPVREQVQENQRRFVRLVLEETAAEERLELYETKHFKAKHRLLLALLRQKDHVLDYRDVTGSLRIAGPTLKAMEQEGVILLERERRYRNPFAYDPVQAQRFTQEFALTEEQQYVVDEIMGEYGDGFLEQEQPPTYLLHGITGSGKTAVYIALAKEMVRRGKQVIVLIPEIALTYQTVMRFYATFHNRVSILNSRMSKGERFDQFERAKNGELDVMIGPRSALFTPFLDLGLIIIDEEHETTYKSETMPCYDAREVAGQRGRMLGASVLLGSATPSMESYHKAEIGEYGKFTLTTRHGNAQLPTVEVVDLREELMRGNRSMFSGALKSAIEERLQRREQVMLFLNRRGYAGFVSCRQCGHVIQCPHCDVSLSFHNDGTMQCHYCGYKMPKVQQCPECGSKYIGTFKAGTQQIEEAVYKAFPQARVLRMDMDTTRNKDGHTKIVEAFAKGEADILVGTQMIVKGHDFPNVTLVGVIAADLSLSVADYRSAERTFQLLAQAAGRAGRSEKPGQVIIQTYQPEHYAVTKVMHHDYQGFYEEEISYRQFMGYPPVHAILSLHVSGKEEEAVKQYIADIVEMAKAMPEHADVICLGPAPEPIAKVNDIYKWTAYFKHPERRQLTMLRDELELKLENRVFEGGRVWQFEM